MYLIIWVMAFYIVFAEWRNVMQNRKIKTYWETLAKLRNDKTIWNFGILPQMNELCLFEEGKNNFVISKLADRRWRKEDGTPDYSKITRWAYLRDLEIL